MSLVMLGWAGCAPKRAYVAQPVPGWDIAQSMMLEPPPELSSSQQQDFARAWRDVQQGNLEAAASELESLSRRYGRSPAIATARGFLELRLGALPAAERYFQTALQERAFGPAHAGYVLAALAAEDEELAYDRLGRLAREFPQHPLVDRYEMTLQVNVAESRLRTARELKSAGRYEEAAAAYAEALEVAPGVPSLYVEAAESELGAGLVDRAIRHARRATELEPDNADAFRILGEAQYVGEDLGGAFEAYRTASKLRPLDVEIRERLKAIEREYEEENLPPQYLGIGDAERVTRAQLAALFYLNLRRAFDGVPTNERVIATDIANHWASTFIDRVLSVGILQVYPNHTFQPDGFVRRVDLSEALARALERLAPEAYDMAMESSRLDQDFADLPALNPSYESVALAVSLGLMSVREENEFEPLSFVSGEEAVAAVDALAAHLLP